MECNQYINCASLCEVMFNVMPKNALMPKSITDHRWQIWCKWLLQFFELTHFSTSYHYLVGFQYRLVLNVMGIWEASRNHATQTYHWRGHSFNSGQALCLA